MAALWSRLQQEVRATVDDFRVKGAVAAFKDAALDTRDMATSLGGELWDGVKSLVAEPVLHVQSLPIRGSVVPLELSDGTVVQATVVEVDTVSDPPRAKVAVPGTQELLTVDISISAVPERPPSPSPDVQEEQARADTPTDSIPGDASSAEGTPDATVDMSLLDLFKEDCRATVNEFREKGAVGAVRDAAVDAATMVGSTASKAVSGARSLATPQAEDTQLARSTDGPELGLNESDAPLRETPAVASNESVNLLDLPFFDSLRQEFQEKGAIGAFKDAALDAKDIIGSTATSAVNGAKSFATPLLGTSTDSGASNREAAQSASSESGGTVEAERDSGVEGVSLLDMPLFDGLKQGYHSTVQDFREKGAMGAVKDAALDAADIVRGSASTALDGARRVGGSILSAAGSDVQPAGEVASRNSTHPAQAKKPTVPEGGILSAQDGEEDLID